jgi:hypothetical protein
MMSRLVTRLLPTVFCRNTPSFQSILTARNYSALISSKFRPQQLQSTQGMNQIVTQRTFATRRRKRHLKIIKAAKGYRGRTNCYKIAYHRVLKARQRMYIGRKVILNREFSYRTNLIFFLNCS